MLQILQIDIFLIFLHFPATSMHIADTHIDHHYWPKWTLFQNPFRLSPRWTLYHFMMMVGLGSFLCPRRFLYIH